MGKLIDIVQSQINAAREEQRLADAREKTNWQYRQQTLNSTAQLQAGIIQQGVEKGVNIESLTKETKAMVANLANAKIRLGTADGPYAGSEWDEKFVANTQAEIASIGDTFSALLFVDEKYKETMQSKGVGDSEGMIDMSQTDPFFIIGQNIGNPNMDTQGKVSWKHEYSEENGGQWFRVTEGPEVEETYRRLYEETGNKKYLNPDGSIKTQHKTSYTENKNALDNANGDENNYGNQMATVPGLSGIDEEAKNLGITDTNKLLNKNYFKVNTYTSGNGIDVYDKPVPMYNDIKMNLQSLTNAEVGLIAGSLNDGTGVSFLNSRAAKVAGMKANSDGMLEMELPVEDNGKFIVNEDGTLQMEMVQFGSPGLKGGRYVRDYSKANSSTHGYSEEDYKALQRGYLWIKMSEMKATKPGDQKLNNEETSKNISKARLNNELNKAPEFKEWQFKAYDSYQEIRKTMEILDDYNRSYEKDRSPNSFKNVIKSNEKKEKLANDFKNILKSKVPSAIFKIEKDKVVMKTPKITKQGGDQIIPATKPDGSLSYDKNGVLNMRTIPGGEITYNLKAIETNNFDINKPEEIERFLINYLIGYNPIDLFPGIEYQLSDAKIKKETADYLNRLGTTPTK